MIIVVTGMPNDFYRVRIVGRYMECQLLSSSSVGGDITIRISTVLLHSYTISRVERKRCDEPEPCIFVLWNSSFDNLL
jgi:hypothetical protein